MTRRVGLMLVHHPVLARDASVVTTSVTNLDVHDIARSAYTYGLERYYIVHPVKAQRDLVARIVGHWTLDSGAVRIPDRQPPMEAVSIRESVEEARRDFAEDAELWVTSAKPLAGALGHMEGAAELARDGRPVLLVFGTGWGLAEEVTRSATRALAPIESVRSDGYNHLSVRAAAAILLDRLLGRTPRSDTA